MRRRCLRRSCVRSRGGRRRRRTYRACRTHQARASACVVARRYRLPTPTDAAAIAAQGRDPCVCRVRPPPLRLPPPPPARTLAGASARPPPPSSSFASPSSSSVRRASPSPSQLRRHSPAEPPAAAATSSAAAGRRAAWSLRRAAGAPVRPRRTPATTHGQRVARASGWADGARRGMRLAAPASRNARRRHRVAMGGVAARGARHFR